MLAEIFMLRLEALQRAAEKPVQAKDPRFVPLLPSAAPDHRSRGPNGPLTSL